MAEQTPSNPENPFSKFTAAHWAWVGGLTVVGIVAFQEAWYWSLLGSAGIVYGFAQSRDRGRVEGSTNASPGTPASAVPSQNDLATSTPQEPVNASERGTDVDTGPIQLHATWYDERGIPLSSTTRHDSHGSALSVPSPLLKVTKPNEPIAQSVSTAERSSAAAWIVGSTVLAVLFYFVYTAASPYWATYRLYKAIQQRDIAGLERVVAFADLRANLKRRSPGGMSAVAIDALVTPSAVMSAIGNRPADSSDDRSLLYFSLATGHRDGDYFVVGDTVVFCRYGLRWRVCDLKSS